MRASDGRETMQIYDFDEFLKEELGGDYAQLEFDGRLRSRDYLLGELLVLVSRNDPPVEYSFNTALVYVVTARDRVRVVHDIYDDRHFEMSREGLSRALKAAIAWPGEARSKQK